MHNNTVHSQNSELERLLDWLTKSAEDSMRRSGGVAPTFAVLIQSSLVILPGDGIPEPVLPNVFRLWAVAAGAKAGVFLAEVWIASAKPGEKLPPNMRPSLSPHRREGIFLSSEALGGIYSQRFLPILRNAAGKFIGFGPAETFPPAPAGGRYGRLLPDQPPTEAERQAAFQALARLGIPPRCKSQGAFSNN